MTRLLLVAATAVALGALAWMLARGLFAHRLFARTNVRGVDVPVGAGILAVLALVAMEAGLGVIDVVDDSSAGDRWARLLVVTAATTFALVGMVDDLVGDHADKGFRGHLRALVAGRLTTGGLKVLVGCLTAVVVVAPTVGALLDLAIGAAVVALGANTANLFDRAPGRTAKVGLVALVVLVVAGSATDRDLLVGVVALGGAVAGLAWFDLREELMLGDAGANPLGAVLGLGVVLTCGLLTQFLVLVALAALNVAGERVSFSNVIERVPVLRALDGLGRRPT